MPKVVTHSRVAKAIKAYANAYASMESVQGSSDNQKCLMPKGDQKTGCIGEYWAMRYAKKQWGDENCIFGTHSQHGWDIRVIDTDIRVQVKTVSDWSETKRLSPIHAQTNPPKNAPDDWARWTHLWLIYLNRDLNPEGFWQLIRENVDFRNRKKLTGLKIRIPAGSKGSSCLSWPENTVSDLLSVTPLEN